MAAAIGRGDLVRCGEALYEVTFPGSARLSDPQILARRVCAEYALTEKNTCTLRRSRVVLVRGRAERLEDKRATVLACWARVCRASDLPASRDDGRVASTIQLATADELDEFADLFRQTLGASGASTAPVENSTGRR
jgi:hypothetical protein